MIVWIRKPYECSRSYRRLRRISMKIDWVGVTGLSMDELKELSEIFRKERRLCRDRGYILLSILADICLMVVKQAILIKENIMVGG